LSHLVVHRFHAASAQLAGILDLLLATLPHRGSTVESSTLFAHDGHVARAHLRPQILRIVWMTGVFHRVQVIEIAEELVEPVHRGQELVAIAEVVLAELAVA